MIAWLPAVCPFFILARPFNSQLSTLACLSHSFLVLLVPPHARLRNGNRPPVIYSTDIVARKSERKDEKPRITVDANGRKKSSTFFFLPAPAKR